MKLDQLKKVVEQILEQEKKYGESVLVECGASILKDLIDANEKLIFEMTDVKDFICEEMCGDKHSTTCNRLTKTLKKYGSQTQLNG
jgi:hypothetical protein